ncbi:hypothetical protein LSTR_LSTR000450 [Laodelphax striatellus]|uniref:RNA helicase n=1 Tax=Laodelphax striatellus TaxID=195883 RepID=A0A482X2C9_LAOST|nr:hypothetical protein LSTR_LSTR000450 [Laodelphax striatellus]
MHDASIIVRDLEADQGHQVRNTIREIKILMGGKEAVRNIDEGANQESDLVGHTVGIEIENFSRHFSNDSNDLLSLLKQVLKDKKSSDSRSKRSYGKGRRTRSRSHSRSPRSRSKSRSHSRERSKLKDEKKDSKADDEPFDPTNLDKEEEQKRLELEMQKRRERIERWRAERKKKELEVVKKDLKSSLANLQLPTKKWNLEDDSDEEEDGKADNNKNDGEEELDPLDAFMQGVQEEVRKVNKIEGAKRTADGQGKVPPAGSGGLVIVTGVAKKKADNKKGELIEQNQDGLEYSSEEEEEDLSTTAASIANKQKKELAKVDHTTIDYTPFRKDFYTEVPEIARMTPEEVEAYREELEGIRVKGKGCPKPIKSWAQCGVSKKVLDALKKQDYEKPTPIQAQAIPAIMSGRDLIGIAKTGSGKTLAFVLPMLRHIMDQPPLEANDGPLSLIMAPTRELCLQIGKETRKFTKSLNLRVVCVYGGTGISEQIAELKRGAEIIV